ncbi:Protein MCM10 homolog [Linum grandiflorum]
MSTHQDDLDLLLSLEDPVNETPPGSPSFDSPGFLSDDDGSPRRRGKAAADLSVFKDAVRDCLDYDVNKLVERSRKSSQLSKKSTEVNVEKYSGLRISNQPCTPVELAERFSDIRFVRLPTIKNSLVGDSISGSWATVGVLTEKGNPRTSSAGKSYSIWKLSCLDENTVSLFLFGDAYKLNSGEKAGTVFGLFNCAIRKDNMGSGFSLSVFSPNQILKMGTSVDYGVCKGKRKDGIACSLIVNKRKGIYCKHHNVKSASTIRTELKGRRNLSTAYRTPSNSRGIYMVDPLADKKNFKKSVQPIKLLTVEGLRKALSGEKVTTNTHSQGMRFLNEVAGKLYPKNSSKVSGTSSQHITSLDKRKLQSMKVNPSGGQTTTVHDDAKRMKTSQGTEKMIELDLIESDEDS